MVKLFVGNLAEGTKGEALRELFKMFGTISEADVVKDFGFVHMETEEEAEAAIKSLNGYSLNGRDIVVEKSRSAGPGRGGRGGRGGPVSASYRGGGGRSGENGSDRLDRYPRRDERDARDYKRPYGDRKDDYRRDDYRRDPLPPRDLPPRDPYVASSRDRYAPRDPYPPRDYPPRDAYPPRDRDPYYGGRDAHGARGRTPPRRSPSRRTPPGAAPYPRDRSPAYGPPPSGYYGRDRQRSPLPPRGRSRSPLPPARGYDDFDRRPPRDYVPAAARSPGPPVERNGAPPRY